jgi:mannosylglycoprotein endo-beta-mannosidase
LEQYQQKKIPLKIYSDISVSGTMHKVKMTVENNSKKSVAESTRSLSAMDLGDASGSHSTGKETTRKGNESDGLWRKISNGLGFARSNDNRRTLEVNGTDSGVAFFLHFSVHTSESSTAKEKYNDTRILPVHYSDNYFSLTPGETMAIDISFEAPQGSSPKVVLRGWNHHLDHAVMI